MPSVAANARSLVHAGSKGITIAFPDLCKTPPALGAPLPYPNIARSADAAKTAKRTSADGQKVCLANSEFSLSLGDEPGSAGGVVSGVIKGKAAFIAGSGDVIIEGKGAARAFDLLTHNKTNTPPFPVLQAPIIALAKTAKPVCLLCGKEADPAAPGNHVLGGGLDELHDDKVRRNDTEGGACLWAHCAGFEATSCCHRWQAAKAVERDQSARYGELPPDAFRTRNVPFWHEVHHLIPPRLLHEAIDAAAGDDAGKADFCRRALLQAGLNVNHGRNLVILPLLTADMNRFALPRRLVIDAASLGIPPALAGAFNGLNGYDLLISYLLKPIVAALAACYRENACAEPGPAPGAVAKLALEKISDLLRMVICAPNRALDWGRKQVQ